MKSEEIKENVLIESRPTTTLNAFPLRITETYRHRVSARELYGEQREHIISNGELFDNYQIHAR